MRDGAVASYDILTESNGYIVEFRDPPLAVAGTGALAGYRATFDRFRGDAAASLNAGRAAKSRIEPDIRWEYYETFNGVSVSMPQSAMARVRQLPYVKRVWPDTIVHALAVTPPADVVQIGANRVWTTLGSRGKGVVVAIIDTGIDYMHPALGGGFGPGYKVIGGYDFVNKDANPMDDAFHGTHVAGTVAGESEQFIGVAPDASLLAFKVLNAAGSGKSSDVLAGIERAADPNGDGDFRDHADVANMSLGGAGYPDDPLSTAVDNATAVGVVFAIAAGNSGAFHSIGSPGTARSAVTVGASDSLDNIASFSSRGPNTRDLSIKPEVVAPGVAIFSAIPNGKYGSLSGTSMAAPHVAGAAALIKSLHRGWTPAQIKQALMNTSLPLSTDIMAQGSGRIDAFEASSANIAVEPSVLSLGLYPAGEATWSVTRTLHFTNSGTQPVTFTADTTSSPAGTSVSVAPPTVSVPGGGSADAMVTIVVTAVTIVPGRDSYTVGGQIVFKSGSPQRVPWALTKAARATLSLDHDSPDAVWVNASHTLTYRTTSTSPTTSETLMPPGSYDAFVFAADLNDDETELLAARLLVREGENLDGDVALMLHETAAAHAFTFETHDEAGRIVSVPDDGLYIVWGRIRYANGSIGAITLFLSGLHRIFFSDISDAKTLSFGQNAFDTAGHRYYAIQHPAIKGVAGDMTFTNAASSLRSADVHIALPQAAGERLIVPIAIPIVAGVPGRGFGWVQSNTRQAFDARVFLASDADSDYSWGWQFQAVSSAALPLFVTPMLRVAGDRVGDGSTMPWATTGTSYTYGYSPRYPVDVVTSPIALRFSITSDYFGPMNEVRPADRSTNLTTFYDSLDRPLSATNIVPASWDLNPKGKYRVESVSSGELVAGVPRRTVVTRTVDSRLADFIPPTLTSMALLDASGAMVWRLEPHAGGALRFSAADYGYSGGKRTYQAVSGDQVAVSVRYSGEKEWRPLQVTEMTEDPGSSSVLGAGTLFRADLGGITNVDRALVDLKIDLADVAGNTSSIVMTPGLAIGQELGPRKRAAR